MWHAQRVFELCVGRVAPTTCDFVPPKSVFGLRCFAQYIQIDRRVGTGNTISRDSSISPPRHPEPADQNRTHSPPPLLNRNAILESDIDSMVFGLGLLAGKNQKHMPFALGDLAPLP